MPPAGDSADRTPATQLVAPVDGPHAADLAACARAFVAGDFRTARERARTTLADPRSLDSERAYATELMRRTGGDRATRWVAIVGFAAILVFYLLGR